jgi:hypothetical protein
MSKLRWLCVVSLLWLLVGSLVAAPAEAQGEGPAGLGMPLPVIGADGGPVGAITITDVIDPFPDFHPDYPPEAGTRYVLVNVAFDADAGQRFDIDPWSIVVQDDAGFLWNQAGVTLPDDAQIPVLSSQTLAPGSRVNGAVGFLIPEGREPSRILYQPQSSQFRVLVDLLGQPVPALGEAVPISDAAGGMGAVTVTAINDPQTDLDPTQALPDGGRYVQAILTYENTSDGPFAIEPYGLLMQDANGNLWYSTYVTRSNPPQTIPDMASVDLAPGDRLTGSITFGVPDGVAVTGLFAAPVSGQLVQLASFDAVAIPAPSVDAPPASTGEAPVASEEVKADAPPASGTTAAEASPAASANEPPPTVEVPEAAPTESATEALPSEAATDDCAALDAWSAATRTRMERAIVLNAEDLTLEDPDVLASHAAEYGELALAQSTELVPPEAAALNKALVATFNAHRAAVEQLLTVEESGPDTEGAANEALGILTAAGARLATIDAEMINVELSCVP